MIKMDRESLAAEFEYDPEVGILMRRSTGTIQNRSQISYRGLSRSRLLIIWILMTGSPSRHPIRLVDDDSSNTRWGNLRADPPPSRRLLKSRRDRVPGSPANIYCRDGVYIVYFITAGKKRNYGRFTALGDAITRRDQVVSIIRTPILD